MADKVKRRRIAPHPVVMNLNLGLVSFANIISAMMMRHPEANPSPRLEYTEQKYFNESCEARILLTNVPMLHSDELWVVLPLPDCEVNLFVCQSSLRVKKQKVFN